MRLYKKDGDGAEWTGIEFVTVKSDIFEGGTLIFTYRDPIMTNIATVQKYLNQRVEVRKDDGSTVIWEGVIRTDDYSSLTSTWTMTGDTPLRIAGEVDCNYNGLLDDGVVTDIDTDDTPPVITDANKTFVSADIDEKYISFTDITEPTKETLAPNSNTAFFNGGIAPDSATGSYTDLDTPGHTGMVLTDGNNRATDYYGIDFKWTVPNQAGAKRVVINLSLEFAERQYYAENGSDAPLVEIWDDDASGWVIADESGISGLGRKADGWEAWSGRANTLDYRTILITSDIGRFFDGSDEIYVRVTMGNSSGNDKVICYYAPLVNHYSDLFDNPSYQIKEVSGSTLTLTGSTPYADGVRIGDTFKVGDLLHNVMIEIWKGASITWVDYTFDTAGLVDATDLRGTMVGSVLKRYANDLNWVVWDEIGWNIKVDDPATSTSLSLTEANFSDWFFGADAKSTTKRVITGCQNRFILDLKTSKGFPSYGDGLIVDNFFGTSTDASQAGANYVTRDEDIKYPFRGTIDTDDGTNYSALQLGKLITVTLYTDKHVFTEVKISSISYDQEAGGHLYCQIKL